MDTQHSKAEDCKAEAFDQIEWLCQLSLDIASGDSKMPLMLAQIQHRGLAMLCNGIDLGAATSWYEVVLKDIYADFYGYIDQRSIFERYSSHSIRDNQYRLFIRAIVG